jgi:hypothetical protein
MDAPPSKLPSTECSAATLEAGGIVTFPVCPFALPADSERFILFNQRTLSRFHKNITYDPNNDRLAGYEKQPLESVKQLQHILADFSKAARSWLATLLPAYAEAWRLDRASYRPEEEALRKLRPTARNDLLHFDSFPTRPSHGDRLLRLFVNLHPTEARVWATSDDFATLLERYGAQVGVPSSSAAWPSRLLRVFQPRARGSSYDQFMLKFHHFLKANEQFQERSPKRLWHFPPAAAWLVFTDGLSYAELRGQFALEHSFFVPPRALARPELAPAAVLERRCGGVVRAA